MTVFFGGGAVDWIVGLCGGERDGVVRPVLEIWVTEALDFVLER